MKTALAIIATLVALPAAAHPEMGAGAAFASGFVHPFTGVDHLLGMLAIGLWSAQQRQSLSVTMMLLATMAVGGLAFGGAAMPLAAELALAAGVALIGARVAVGGGAFAGATTMLVAGFVLLHGQAHSAGLPGAASAAGYVLSSGLLIMAGRLCQSERLRRMAGVAIGLTGLSLLARLV